MNNFTAMAARIIPVLAGRFVALVFLAVSSLGVAQAQDTFKVKLGIDYKGGLYTVHPTAVPAGDRVELPVAPSGVLKVYARSISIPGVAGQALVDLQVYEMRAGALAQISALTMPVYLSTENTADVDSKQGKLKISAFVEGSSGGAPVASAPSAAPSQAPVSGPAFAPAPAVAPVPVPSMQAPQPQRRPAGTIRAPEGAVPIPSTLPGPSSSAAPVSGGFSPLPRSKTAKLSGGSCHDLAFPEEG